MGERKLYKAGGRSVMWQQKLGTSSVLLGVTLVHLQKLHCKSLLIDTRTCGLLCMMCEIAKHFTLSCFRRLHVYDHLNP